MATAIRRNKMDRVKSRCNFTLTRRGHSFLCVGSPVIRTVTACLNQPTRPGVDWQTIRFPAFKLVLNCVNVRYELSTMIPVPARRDRVSQADQNLVAGAVPSLLRGSSPVDCEDK